MIECTAAGPKISQPLAAGAFHGVAYGRPHAKRRPYPLLQKSTKVLSDLGGEGKALSIQFPSRIRPKEQKGRCLEQISEAAEWAEESSRASASYSEFEMLWDEAGIVDRPTSAEGPPAPSPFETAERSSEVRGKTGTIASLDAQSEDGELEIMMEDEEASGEKASPLDDEAESDSSDSSDDETSRRREIDGRLAKQARLKATPLPPRPEPDSQAEAKERTVPSAERVAEPSAETAKESERPNGAISPVQLHVVEVSGGGSVQSTATSMLLDETILEAKGAEPMSETAMPLLPLLASAADPPVVTQEMPADADLASTLAPAREGDQVFSNILAAVPQTHQEPMLPYSFLSAGLRSRTPSPIRSFSQTSNTFPSLASAMSLPSETQADGAPRAPDASLVSLATWPLSGEETPPRNWAVRPVSPPQMALELQRHMARSLESGAFTQPDVEASNVSQAAPSTNGSAPSRITRETSRLQPQVPQAPAAPCFTSDSESTDSEDEALTPQPAEPEREPSWTSSRFLGEVPADPDDLLSELLEMPRRPTSPQENASVQRPRSWRTAGQDAERTPEQCGQAPAEFSVERPQSFEHLQSSLGSRPTLLDLMSDAVKITENKQLLDAKVMREPLVAAPIRLDLQQPCRSRSTEVEQVEPEVTGLEPRNSPTARLQAEARSSTFDQTLLQNGTSALASVSAKSKPAPGGLGPSVAAVRQAYADSHGSDPPPLTSDELPVEIECLEDEWLQVSARADAMRKEGEGREGRGAQEDQSVVPLSYRELQQWLQQFEVDERALRPLQEEMVEDKVACGCMTRRRSMLNVRGLDAKQNKGKDLTMMLKITHFDFNVPIHFRMLRTIYCKLTRNKICPWIGGHWELLGFQGTDPRRDLNRSGGLLNVIHMFYSFCHHFELLKGVYLLSLDTEQNFPLFCVSINISQMVIENFVAGRLSTLCNDDGVFAASCKVHAAGLFHFYSQWRSQKRTIMDASKTKQEVSALMERSPALLLDGLMKGDREQRAKSDPAHLEFTDMNFGVAKASATASAKAAMPDRLRHYADGV